MWPNIPRASFRGLTPIDPVEGAAHLSFAVVGQADPVRLIVDAQSLRELVQVAGSYLEAHSKGVRYASQRPSELSDDQSDNSSGSAQADVSSLDEGEKV